MFLFQVSSLKSAQVEFESMKHEVKRLLEEADIVQAQLEEANKLKHLAEKQIEEALLSLQQEREQRLTLKKEFDQLKSAEQLMQLNNLANNFLRMGAGGPGAEEDEGENESPGVLKQLESAFVHDDSASDSGLSGGKGDLFSEVHGARLGQLEADLAAAKKERADAEKRLQVRSMTLFAFAFVDDSDDHSFQDLQKRFEEATTVLGERADEVLALMNALKTVEPENHVADEKEGEVQSLQTRFARALQEIANLQAQIQRDAVGDELKTLLSQQQVEIQKLQEDLQTLSQMAGDTQSSLLCAQDFLIVVSEGLAQLYHHVCMVQGKTPDRVMLDHMKAIRANAKHVEALELPVRETAGGETSGAESGTEDRTPRFYYNAQGAAAARLALSEKFLRSLRERLKSEFRNTLADSKQQQQTEEQRKETPMFQVRMGS